MLFRLGKICLSPACLLLACACNYKTIVASQDFSNDVAVMPERPATDSVYLLGGEDRIPDSSRLLAVVTLYSPLLWPGSYGHSPLFLMLDRAKKEVREMGGNAMLVLDCSAKKFARIRMVARVYSLKQAPELPVAPTGDCIVHLKSYYPVNKGTPVPIYFNDSVIAMSTGSDVGNHRDNDFVTVAQQRMEQFTIDLDKGGPLSIKEPPSRFLHYLILEQGEEYYIFVVRLGTWQGSLHFFELVTKEEFDMNYYRY